MSIDNGTRCLLFWCLLSFCCTKFITNIKKCRLYWYSNRRYSKEVKSTDLYGQRFWMWNHFRSSTCVRLLRNFSICVQKLQDVTASVTLLFTDTILRNLNVGLYINRKVSRNELDASAKFRIWYFFFLILCGTSPLLYQS